MELELESETPQLANEESTAAETDQDKSEFSGSGENGLKHGDSTIVIHPGSLHLRIGLACDSMPKTIPHCIAWRSRNSSDSNIVPWISRPETEHGEAIRMVITSGMIAQRQLGDLHKTNGKFRQATSADQLASLNDIIDGDESDVKSQLQWTDVDTDQPEYVIGEDALYLDPESGYHIIWPISYGELNVSAQPGHTVANISQSLETLWSSAIEKFLDIPKAEFKDYTCILLIPDIFNRSYIRAIMQIILERLNFSAAFLIQESVCAGFGVGLSSVCVVDVGDHKTSITCVEDGISLEPSRITLRYGGRDITRTFSWLLDHISFPYIDCQLDTNVLDTLLLQELKHSYCHMDTDSVGTEEIHFQVRPPASNIVRYSMHVGDERIVPTLAVFWPDMFGLQGDKLLLNGAYRDNDHTDVLDADYIHQTRSKQEESARLAALKKKELANQPEDSMLDESSQRDLDDDMDAGDDPVPPTSSSKNSDGQSNNKKTTLEEKLPSDKLMALDLAIIWSIEQCDNDELKKKMYGNILLVGGGLLFEGVESLLQYRVWLNLPPQYQSTASVNVLTRSKDVDPQYVCWKGGSILSVLDTIGEQWISREEWITHQSRIVREKALFSW